MKRTPLLGVSVAVIAVLATALLVWLPAPATGPATDNAGVTSDNTPGLAPGSAVLRATIDPETGGVKISAAPSAMPLDAETQSALRRDSEGLTEVYHPNGAVSVNLQGRFQNVSVARIGKDGKLVICSESHEQIEGALQNPEAEIPAARQDLEVR